MSVSECIIASPTGHISVNFDNRNIFLICRENGNLVPIWQKYRPLLEDEVCFIVAGDKDFLRVKYYRAAGIAEELIKLRKRAAVLRYAYIVYIVLIASHFRENHISGVHNI
jgi:hypothetical protein